MLTIVRFVNIILAALLAGVSFGIWMGLNPVNYSPATYIEQQKNLVQSLNTLMIALVVLATLVTLLSAFLQRRDKSTFLLLLLAAAFFISCMFITRLGNVPIQTEMLRWTTDTLPENWTELRDKWWSLHFMRTVVELVALVLVAWTAVRHKHHS